jgi:lipid-A-disaccharide synthase
LNPARPVFGMVAGEPSGDLLAGLLLDGLKARWPDLQAVGIGGPHMLQRGFQAWWAQSLLAVRGYAEVLPHLFKLLSIRRALGARLIAHPPDVFIGIDAPDFNFGLEARLKTAGIPTVHFVSPSFWAWRAGKLANLKASADHVLCIFPFEPPLLAQHGIAATYVGHPLASVIPQEPDRRAARAALGLPADGPVVALLPGSRESEIRYLAARFLAAARLILQRRPATRFVLPAMPALRAAVEQAAQAGGLGNRLLIVTGQSQRVLAACDVTLIASGTATLEAALFKRPMVIAYNMNWLSWQLMRHRNLQPWVGLPNILCREFVVPELLQDAATPQALAAAVLDWMDSPEKTLALQQRFAALHQELRRDTAQLATDAIEKILSR